MLSYAPAAIALATTAFLAKGSEAAPFVLARAAGPSGQLLSPASGDTIAATQGHPDGHIAITYAPVYIDNSTAGGCGGDACFASTYYISVNLTNNGNTYPLAQTLTNQYPQSAANISAYLVAPKGVCGNSTLTVSETQNLYGKEITFVSAAPQITIDCAITP